MSFVLKRCWNTYDPLHLSYHDNEWGVPLHNDRKLFEFLVLGGFQAGLTWDIILRRRNYFRQAFDFFNFEKIADYTTTDVNRLLSNKSIIRNLAKIKAAITNARAFKTVVDEYGSFDTYIWKYVDGKPIINNFKSYYDAPVESNESNLMSHELQQRGFVFVGPKICYAFMQATGMVNDHSLDCFRHKQIADLSANL